MRISNLLHVEAGTLKPTGSFALQPPLPSFTPWGSEVDGPALGPEGALDIESIRQDAFAQGFEEGRASAELEYAEERMALAQLSASLSVLQPEPTNALALMLALTVDRLVRQIVGSVEVDGALLRSRAEAAAALLGAETAPARLRVNPADLPHFEYAELPVSVIGDPHIDRGALVLETGQGWIEDGPAVRLDRLRAELDRMGAPQ
jgi:flagellar assembly protein FliH